MPAPSLLLLGLALAALGGARAGLSHAPPKAEQECTGAFVLCDPFFLLAGSPMAIVSTQPELLDEETIPPDNQIGAVALFAFASESSTWLLPTTIGLLTNAQVWASQGGVRGTIPTQLGLMRSLKHFALQFAKHVIGSLPSEMGTLRNISAISLADVPNLSGPIPSQFGLLRAITSLVLTNCNLQGTLPPDLRVRDLQIEGNNLTGTLPEGLLLDLDRVSVNDNRLTGELPKTFQAPIVYSTHNNQFNGTIPTDLGPQLQHLSDVGLHNNLLTGSLPSQIAAMTNLFELHVYLNRLSGPLPSQLGRMTRLTSLRLDQNLFSGALPSELGLLTALTRLDVASNRLDGPVPSQLALLADLVALNISHNSLTGSLPRQLARLTALRTVSVEGNRLKGHPPSEVWEQECDDSGLDSSGCWNHCSACHGNTVELLECNKRGRGQWCASVPGLCISAAVIFLCVVTAHKGGNVTISATQLGFHTGVMVFSVFETSLDLLFALRSAGAIRVIAFVSFGAGRVIGAVLGATTLVHWQRRWWQVVAGTALCSVNAAALKGLLPLRAQAKSGVVRRWIVVLGLAESLVEGSLQAYSVVNGNQDAVVVLGLLFSAASLIATATVVAVFSLANYHAASALLMLDNQDENMPQGDLAPPSPKGESKNEDRCEGGPGGQARRCSNWCKRIPRFLLCASCCFVAAVALANGRGSVAVPPIDLAAAGTAPRWPLHLDPPASKHSDMLARWGRQPRQGDSHMPHSKAVVCPPDGVVGLPFTCFAGQVYVILDTEGFFENNTGVFFEAMEQPEVRLMSLSNQALPIPSTVAMMQHLNFLALFDGVGPLPTQIGLVTSLKALMCMFVRGSNVIPSEIGNLAALQVFFLQDVDGVLPSQIGRASLLRSLRLKNAGPLVPWNLPSQLGLLSSLDGLAITFTHATGSIPSQLGLLADSLTFLDLGGNEFRGPVPSELGLLSSLELVSLAGSDLHGTMPDFLSLPLLQHCEVGGQSMQGSLPSTIPVGSPLVFVGVEGNNLRGTIPSQLGRATSMTHLSIADNSLTGTIPTQLGLLTLLTHLSLHAQGLDGPLPSQLARLSLLELLHVNGNSLQGTIPTQLALLGLLTNVRLGDNGFDPQGLPSAFAGRIREVWLEECDYSGVHDAECARTCPSCHLGEARILPCDGRGFGGYCSPLWVIVLAVGLMTGALRLLVRQVGEQQPSLAETGIATLLTLVATAHVLFDVLFALLAPPVIRGCAMGAMFVAVFVRFVLSTGEFFRTQLRKHVAAQGRSSEPPANKSNSNANATPTLASAVWTSSAASIRHDVKAAALDTKLFAAALVLSTLDPSTLFHVFHSSTENTSTTKALRAKVLWAKLVDDLPQLVLQAVLIDQRADDSFAIQALVLTVFSIVLGVAEWRFGSKGKFVPEVAHNNELVEMARLDEPAPSQGAQQPQKEDE